MMNGDISNEVVPRLLIEFEGLVGNMSDGRNPLSRIKSLGNWKSAANSWELNETVLKIITHRADWMKFDIDVITIGPAKFAEALFARFENEDIPVKSVWSYTPEKLARRVEFMQRVAAVYTPEQKHALMYGNKGRYITPDNVNSIGRF